MRIAIVTDAWAPQVNGVVRTLEATRAHLLAAGHDVLVVAPDAFASLVANLPAVTSVLMFVLGLLAFVAGIVLLIVGIRNLRRRWHRFNLIARHVDSRPQYGDVGGDDGGDGGEGWEPAAYR